MKVLEVVTFHQPTGDIITLQRMETPFYPPASCERLVDGYRLQGCYGWEIEKINQVMSDWKQFEQSIGSTLL